MLEFPTSMMGRHLLSVQAHCGNVEMDLLNTHLESMKCHSEERMRQLRQCLEIMIKRPSDRSVIFGGDLNIRDKEIVTIGGLPPKVIDVWEYLGRRRQVEFTWDMKNNTNKHFDGFKPRCRFDRVYLRRSVSDNLTVTQFDLEGRQKIREIRKSDHWAIRIRLKLYHSK